ncbi:hypothetical protein ANN_23310 [Periplaneta americana]|uniref:Uncharacterized protein n=1 Tax=Periplaneta americana TaxID=6978 RepID=A0ABQ8SKS8_PERAM|nr:hypothetical protein ANN_23310 [Periplaneta americana]
MAGLCEDGSEPPGSLKAFVSTVPASSEVTLRIAINSAAHGQISLDECGLPMLRRSQAKSSTRSSYLLAWPQNSPDLTPPDFFVWDFVKDIVYPQKPRNIGDLIVKITQAFQQITPLMLQRTWAELHHRYELCRVRNGVMLRSEESPIFQCCMNKVSTNKVQ